jgi:hypothetical protein
MSIDGDLPQTNGKLSASVEVREPKDEIGNKTTLEETSGLSLGYRARY